MIEFPPRERNIHVAARILADRLLPTPLPAGLGDLLADDARKGSSESSSPEAFYEFTRSIVFGWSALGCAAGLLMVAAAWLGHLAFGVVGSRVGLGIGVIPVVFCVVGAVYCVPKSALAYLALRRARQIGVFDESYLGLRRMAWLSNSSVIAQTLVSITVSGIVLARPV